MDVMIEIRASEGGDDAKELVSMLTEIYVRAGVRNRL